VRPSQVRITKGSPQIVVRTSTPAVANQQRC